MDGLYTKLEEIQGLRSSSTSRPIGWIATSQQTVQTRNGLALAQRNGGEAIGQISYIWTREGWLYLAVMIDLHSRRVVGWSVSTRLKYDLALQALNRALALLGPACRLHPSFRQR